MYEDNIEKVKEQVNDAFNFAFSVDLPPSTAQIFVSMVCYYWLLTSRGINDPACNVMNPIVRNNSQL